MKFAQAVSLLAGLVPARASNPALGHIHLDTKDGVLVGRASNGEVDLEIRTTEAALELDPGGVLVPPAGFARFVASLKEPALGYDPETRELVISGGAASARFRTGPADDFPEMRAFGGEVPRVRIPAGELRRALSVRFASSAEDYRAIFRGVQFEFREKGFRTAASDGFRLAVYDFPESEGKVERLFVIARKSLDVLSKLLPGDESSVEVAVQGPQVQFVWEGVRLVLTAMEGQFPDYERVVPKEITHTIEAPRDDLLAALKRLAPLTDPNTARVDVRFEDGAATLTAEGDYGKANDRVELLAVQGKPVLQAYNLHYLQEALQHVDTDRATLELSGPVTPAVIRGGSTWSIVVPLRT
ncbi:DNA polymerase III subunit beta [Oceanithermus sp.]|uniref:DNA polymerase III subunit beta n=1 Tax=Oceanithermus sp. TaxID=2268145 RepID=UPI002579EC27|nr:DNA polymerase III subunit beta [Oceanithermus sp.]